MTNLKKIQNWINNNNINFFILNRSDEFLNEYIAPYAERLKWLTNFSGSAGRAIIGQNKANLFVDGRYTFQAKEQIDDSVISLLHLNDYSKELNKHFNNNFEVELSPGLVAGQKLIPVNTVGCYVPGGRNNYIASAIMSITTAKVAGVKTVIAASPPKDKNGANPIIIYTANLCGANIIMNLGGIAAIGAFA